MHSRSQLTSVLLAVPLVVAAAFVGVQAGQAPRKLAGEDAGQMMGPGWTHSVNSRAQAQECHAQLQKLITSRNPASVLPEANQMAWGMVEQRRKDLVAALDKWHAEHGSNIDEGHTGQVTPQQQFYLALAQIPCVKTVCEIGFNGGHSTAVWLSARDDIHVMSFDLGAHPYAFTALQFFSTVHSGRITSTFGDSTKTVPHLARKVGRICDLLIVDGGHNYEIAIADIANMAHMANPHFNIFVMDDVNCAPGYCDGPKQALQEAVNRQLLNLDFRYSYSEAGTEVAGPEQAVRGFSFGRYNVPHHHRIMP